MVRAIAPIILALVAQQCGAIATQLGDVVTEEQEPIQGGWIYVGSLDVGCAGGESPPTKIKVLFDTGSSLLVVKTGRTFDAVAHSTCEKIGEMFVNATGCKAGVCGHCYRHTSCYKDLKKQTEIDYGSGPVMVHAGAETVVAAGKQIDTMIMGELVDFGVKTFTRKDFQGICGLMHNAGGNQGGKSLFQYLREQDMYAFGYCINEHGQSKIDWYDDRKMPGAKRVEVICQHHWGVTFADFHVGSKPVRPKAKKHAKPLGGVPKSEAVLAGEGGVCGNSPCAAILDTGTNFIVGPESIIKPAVEMIEDAGFREDCSFTDSQLPDLKFKLGDETFTVKPQHYYAKETGKDRKGNKVQECILLLGPMSVGEMEADSEESRSQPLFILGTPFMRSNYIKFAHPKDSGPEVWISEKCPDDMTKDELSTMRTVSQNSNVALEVGSHGEVSRVPSPVLRSLGSTGTEGNMDTQKIQGLEQLPGKHFNHKNWYAAMQGGRECSPGKHIFHYKDTPK